MAEGFLASMAADRFDVYSAGSKATELNTNAITVMAEVGVDISGHRSKSVDEFAGQQFDFVITVCYDNMGSTCPVFSGYAEHREHWPFHDPAAATGDVDVAITVFRDVRDQIRNEVEDFMKKKARIEF